MGICSVRLVFLGWENGSVPQRYRVFPEVFLKKQTFSVNKKLITIPSLLFLIFYSWSLSLFFPLCRKQEKPPLWDSFQDPPPQKDTGSSATWNKLNFFLKTFKFLTYIFVCFAILGCTFLSKTLYLLMASNVRSRNCTYCNPRGMYIVHNSDIL